jgi:hypothetical protein
MGVGVGVEVGVGVAEGVGVRVEVGVEVEVGVAVEVGGGVGVSVGREDKSGKPFSASSWQAARLITRSNKMRIRYRHIGGYYAMG